jgi:peptide/nickel transport system substrate-binding protein
VLEAFEGYWRKTPSVKRLVMRVIPDEATRLAALKRGEVDIAYSIRSELAEELQRTPGLTLKPVVLQAPNWLYFPEQWDPKSPWHNLRVRQAANLAIDREGMSQALFLGHCKITNSIIPYTFDFYWQPPPAVYDPVKAKKLLADAGYPNGFDAGLMYCDSSYANMAEVSVNNFQQIGIRIQLQPIERAAFFAGYTDKKYTRGVIQGASGAFGNAATRLAAFVVKGGAYGYGSYPDIDELYPQQADELDHEKRAAILEKDATARLREGDLRTDLAARLSERRRSTGRRVGLRPDPWFRLYRALRGHHDQGRLTRDGIAPPISYPLPPLAGGRGLGEGGR